MVGLRICLEIINNDHALMSVIFSAHMIYVGLLFASFGVMMKHGCMRFIARAGLQV